MEQPTLAEVGVFQTIPDSVSTQKLHLFKNP